MSKGNVEILLEELDENDLNSLLRTYDQVNAVHKEVKDKLEMLKTKIRISLKEKKWDSYKDDESQISVTLSSQQRESVNKDALRMLLNDEQYNQVIKKTSSERLMIINPKDRERLKQYAKR